MAISEPSLSQCGKALHIFNIFKEFEPLIFSFCSYSSRLEDLGEQKLISVSYDPDEVDTNQNRIVLIDCNEYSLSHEFESAMSQSNTQAIIVIKLSSEHYEIIRNYYSKLKCPVLMITSESDCAIIAETVDHYSALMAKISGGDNEGFTPLPAPPSIERELTILEILCSEGTMHSHSILKQPELFYKVIKLIRQSQNSDLQSKGQHKKTKKIFEEGLTHILKNQEAITDFPYYLTFIKEIYKSDDSKFLEAAVPFLNQIESHIAHKSLKNILQTFYQYCHLPSAPDGFNNYPKKLSHFISKEKANNSKPVRDAKELAERLYWNYINLLVEEVFNLNTPEHFSFNFWNSFFSTKCRVSLSDDATFRTFAVSRTIAQEIQLDYHRTIQPFHFIPLIMKEKALKSIVTILERLLTTVEGNETKVHLSSYSQGKQFIKSFKDYLFSLDDARMQQLQKDPEFVNSAYSLLNFLANLIHQAKNYLKDEEKNNDDELALTWVDIFNILLQMLINKQGNFFPDTYPNELLQFRSGIKLHKDINRKWNSKFVNPTISTTININKTYYSPTVFYDFLDKFSIILPKNYITEYLSSYDPRSEVSLVDPIWTKIFRKSLEISAQYQNPHHVYECILAALFKICKIYNVRSQDNSKVPGVIEFLRDVLRLNLDLNANYQYNIQKLSETDPWKLFFNLLDKSKVILQTHLSILLNTLSHNNTTTNTLQEWFMEIIVNMVMPIHSEVMARVPQTPTECVFNEIKNLIQKWLKSPDIKELTPRYYYAWKIMSSCCKRLDGIRHLELYNMPLFVTYLFGIYLETMNIAESYEEEYLIQNVVGSFNTLIDFLKTAAYELQKKKITYTVLREYCEHSNSIQQLYHLAGLQTSFTIEELGMLNTQYNNVNRELSKLLILQLPKIEFPECNSQQLRDALEIYGVDTTQLQQINQNFKIVQTLSSANSLYAIEPMPDVKISDYETFTSEVKIFLQSLVPYHSFFSHFHLQKNELFDACIESFCSNLRHNGQPFLIEVFVSALKSTKSLLVSILNGESRYADIKPIVERLNLKNLNFDLMKSQFRKYPEFAKNKIDLNFMDMFELLQYKEHLPIVIDICKKYGLDGCIKSNEFTEISQYAVQLQKEEIVNELTITSASHHLMTLKKCLSNVTPPRLKIFEVMMNAQEFYNFFTIDEYHKEERKSVFFDEIELITRDMQNEDYNDKILSHLQIAYNFILPFCDTKQNFAQLMEHISSDKFAHGEASGFEQLSTVSLNVNLIKLWFLKSKGETPENDAQQLEEMLINGYFEINLTAETVKYKDYTPVSLLDPSADVTVDDHNSSSNLYSSLPIVLKYRASLRSGRRPETEFVYHNGSEEDKSIFRIMTKDMMNDFVRKLGFMEFDQKESLREKAQKFKHYYAAIRQLTDVLISLHFYGHPQYIDHGETFAFSTNIEEIYEIITNYRSTLITWKGGLYKLQDEYSLLCHFTMQRVSTIIQHLKNSNWFEAAQHLAFLFDRVPELLESLSNWLMTNISTSENNENLAKHMGKILNLIKETPELRSKMSILNTSSHTLPQQNSIETPICHHIHKMHNFSDEQIMCLMFTFYNAKADFVPHNTEIIHCSTNITEEELDLFLKKGETFPHFTYTILKVNLLPINLQEKIVSHMSQHRLHAIAQIHYIETGPSVLGELSTVCVHTHVPGGEEKTAEKIMRLCSNYLINNKICDIQLVYGAEGVGKSHYILEEIEKAREDKEISVIHIPIHEGFTLSSVIKKVKEGCDSRIMEGNIIYFNFTIAMPSDSECESDYSFKRVMSSINWFLFDMLILGYVYDPVTGECFYMPSGLNWKLYVEVPIQIYHGSAINDNQRYLQEFQTYVPIFKFVGNPNEILPIVYFQVDDKVQLVCKYLKAYDDFINRKEKHRLNVGINTLYSERTRQKNCFNNKNDIAEKQCLEFLNKYMHEDIKSSKTLQKIYISYMYRRCRILEDFPQFNFNTGASEIYVEDEENPSKWKRIRIDMRKLGSTLMKIMLDEVNLTFCSLTLNKDWNSVDHHQLVYECVGGAYTISYLSLAPEKLDKTLVQDLANIGVFVPPRDKLAQRTLLDPFLARAMGIRLTDDNKILDIIDKENYVLTSDFVMKMININERRMCKVPVIIEGETGVGKTELIKMLSILWTKPHLESISFWKDHLAQQLNDKVSLEIAEVITKYFNIVSKLQKSFHEFSTIDLAENFKNLIELIRFYFAFFVKEFTTLINNPAFYLLDLKDEENRTYNHLIQKLFTSAVAVEDCHEMAQLLCQIFSANMLPTFHKFNVHSALTPEDVKNYFHPIINKANHITEKHGNRFPNPPTITVFIDEINTSSCLGMFKEIIIDYSIDGTPLPSNLFLIAASNPHRATSIPISTYSARSDWVLGWYHVKEIHPTMQLLKWNFGALNHEQEAEYIKSLMQITAKKMNKYKDSCRYFDNLTESEYSRLSAYISRGQKNVREFARDALMKLAYDENEANVRSKSSVSQRDIQRVFHLIEFFGSYIEPLDFTQDKPINSYMICRRIIFVAIGVVYYLRLDPDYRKLFRAKMLIDLEIQSFEMVFDDEIKYLISKTELPPGIALTQGLRENLFATIVCTVTKIPLIIIGPPGTSKTLSFNLTVQNLNKARQLESRNIQSLNFPSLDPHYYQCSRKSTSKEIENVFKRAIFRQDGNNQAKIPINCVVFLDEAGLPEEQQDSLKVLHYYLDKPVVSFVAISNHILDAAKSNRAINVFRPQKQDKNDLQELAIGCFHDIPSYPAMKSMLDHFCFKYQHLQSELIKNKTIRPDFYGLRDFIHFLSYLKRSLKPGFTLQPEDMIRAFERNFSGLEADKFLDILFYFINWPSKRQIKILQRNMVDVLKESIEDKSIRPQKKDGKQLKEVRFKLILDPSEDDTVIRLLFYHNVLDAKSRIFICSDFIQDDELQKVNLVSAIRSSASQGHTVILSHADEIFECFYDVFNQNYKQINDVKTGVRYYANIAIGSHTKLCRIHPSFQCVVHMHKSELEFAPAPFLNRFEKYLITQHDIKNASVAALPGSLKVLVEAAMEKINTFLNNLIPKDFYCKVEDTLNSLIIDFLPKLSQPFRPDFSKLRAPNQVYDSSDTNEVDEETKDPHVYLDILIEALREQCGFHINHLSTEERNSIAIDILENAKKHLPDAMTEYYAIKQDPCIIKKWVGSAILKLQAVDDPNMEYTQNAPFTTKLVVFYGERMVCSMILQFMIRYICSQLLKITIPETIIINKKYMPEAYRKHYLSYQNHFSLKALIQSHLKLLDEVSWDTSIRPTKLICFTITNSFLHKLPEKFPCSRYSPMYSIEKEGIDIVSDINDCIFSNSSKIAIYNLNFFQSQEHFLQELKQFFSSDQSIFILVVNMQLGAYRRINFARNMIEQEERFAKGERKLFVFLLHYSPGIFHSYSRESIEDNNSKESELVRYPTNFVLGWDHNYIDCISPTNNETIVDIQTWLKVSLQEDYSCTEWKEPFVNNLIAFLNSLIGEIPGYIQFNAKKIDEDFTTLNSSSLSIANRIKYLREIFKKTQLGRILCEIFANYWNPKTIHQRLVIASSAVISRSYNLNISNFVQTNIGFLFTQFIIEMVYKLNDNLNLDTLFAIPGSNMEDYDDAEIEPDDGFSNQNGIDEYIIIEINRKNTDLFESILLLFDELPIIEELDLVTRYKPCSVTSPCCSPHYPFSKYVFDLMEDIIQELFTRTNTMSLETPVKLKEFDITIEQESCLKERILTELISTLESIQRGEVNGKEKYRILNPVLNSFNDSEFWKNYKRDFIVSRLKLLDGMGNILKTFPELWSVNFDKVGKDVITRFANFHVENYFHPPDASQNLYLALKLQSYISNTEEAMKKSFSMRGKDLSEFILFSLRNHLLEYQHDNVEILKQWTLNYECVTSDECIFIKHLTTELKTIYSKLHYIYLNNALDKENWTYLCHTKKKIQEFNIKGVFFSVNSSINDSENTNSVQDDEYLEEATPHHIIKKSRLKEFVEGIRDLANTYQIDSKYIAQFFLGKFLDHYIKVWAPIDDADFQYLLQLIVFILTPPQKDNSSEEYKVLYNALSFQHLEHLFTEILSYYPIDESNEELEQHSILPFNSLRRSMVANVISNLFSNSKDQKSLFPKPYFESLKIRPSFEAYLPPYYTQKSHFIPQPDKTIPKYMQHTFAYLYFSLCVNEFSILMNARELEYIILEYDKLSVIISHDNIDSVEQIEKQALLQIILEKYSLFFSPQLLYSNRKEIEEFIQNKPHVLERINGILKSSDIGGGKRGGHAWVLLSWIFTHFSSTEEAAANMLNHIDNHIWIKHFEHDLAMPSIENDRFDVHNISYNKIFAFIKDNIAAQNAPNKDNSSITKRDEFIAYALREIGNHMPFSFWLAIFNTLYKVNITYELDYEIDNTFPKMSKFKRNFLKYFANPEPRENNPNLFAIYELLIKRTHLQRTIINYVNIILTVPDDSCFFYYNTFAPDVLAYLPGSLCLKPIGDGKLAFIDFMFYLNSDGMYTSDLFLLSSHSQRTSFSLQTFYLMTILNYSSLLLCYLTQGILRQTEVIEKLFSKDFRKNLPLNLISCIKTTWKHFVKSCKCSEETMVVIINDFFKNMQKSIFEYPDDNLYQKNIFIEIKNLIIYERYIHQLFHVVRSSERQDLRQPQFVKNICSLQHRIHKTITAEDVIYFIQPKKSDEIQKIALDNYEVLFAFITIRKQLRVGALLLPLAIKLYQAIHVDLNYGMTKEIAQRKDLLSYIREVVNKFKHMEELIGVSCDFFKYFREYVRMRKPNLDFECIFETIFVYDLLTLDTSKQEGTQTGKNLLTTIISDIVELHNSLIDLAWRSNNRYLFLSDDEPPGILLTEESAQSNMITDLSPSELLLFRQSDQCNKGNPPPPLTEQKLAVSELYRKRSYNLLADGTSGFNIDALENDIILTYIAPKFKFEDLQPKKYYFRTQGSFNPSDSQYSRVKIFEESLNPQFKLILTEEMRKDLSYHFHMLDYNMTLTLLKGIQNAINFLVQRQFTMKDDEDLSNFTLSDHAKEVMHIQQWEKAIQSFEFHRLSIPQSTFLSMMKLSYIFETYCFFYDKYTIKYYEFCHLSFSVKVPLSEYVSNSLDYIICCYLDSNHANYDRRDAYKAFLENLQVRLQYNETEIVKTPKNSTSKIIQKVNHFDTDQTRTLNLLENHINNEHYVHLVLKIKSMIFKLETGHPALKKWDETVDNFWDNYLPYFCEHSKDDSVDFTNNVLFQYYLDFFDTEFEFSKFSETGHPILRERPGVLFSRQHSNADEQMYDIIPKGAHQYLD